MCWQVTGEESNLFLYSLARPKGHYENDSNGQNKYTSGSYDKDVDKLYRVEDRLTKKEKKYEKKYGGSPYDPINMKNNLKKDAKYDAKEAYNKNLSGKARLHYLENNIADRSFMSKHSHSK